MRLPLPAFSALPGAPAVRALALLALLPAALAAQGRPAYGNIAGLVTDTLGAPVPAAEVVLLGPQRRAVTTDKGEFRMLNVEAGRLTLVVRRVGYVPAGLTVDLAPGETARIAYAMTPLPQQLAPVAVTEERVEPRFAAFERRRKSGLGDYWTRADIEREQPTRTTDLLRATPGLFMNDQRFGVYLVQNQRFNTLSGEYCTMPVILDGTPLTGDFSPDLVDPKEIEGIEVYRNATQVPTELGTNGKGCGVIVIWTRNR